MSIAPSVTRVDLGTLRKAILVALGPEKFHKYWDTLKAFTQFQLSKDELDTNAKAVLGADNIPLHNELIKGDYPRLGAKRLAAYVAH